MAFYSSNSADYIDEINKLSKPEYTSKYGGTISNLLNKITNKEKFSYDFNADPLYQNYKDQYLKTGNEISMNTIANAATMTGGFGNSYGATAASQANQQYMTGLNNIIPELYNAALSKYQMEVDDLYNQFNAYSTEENRLYGNYRDQVSDYYSDYSALTGGYSNAQAAEQWAAEMAYQKERDAISDAQWEKQYALSLAKANSSQQKAAESTDRKLEQTEKRSVTFQNKEREKNIIATGQKYTSDDEKIAFLNRLAMSDSTFNQADWNYFAGKIGL